MRTFYLGVHNVTWLSRMRMPLCVSYHRLSERRRIPRRLDDAPWMLDSGAFTEISTHGGWTISPATYARFVSGLYHQGRGPDWVGIQDWMCETFILRRTGKTVRAHQALTVSNYLDLRSMRPSVPWAPTLQGQSPDDYLRHADDLAAGVDLSASAVVGVGSVCRLQRTEAVVDVFRALAPLNLRLHGYGVKQAGLERVGAMLHSSDSLAWSTAARMKHTILPNHRHGRLRFQPRLGRLDYGNCANCPVLAARYYERMSAYCA